MSNLQLREDPDVMVPAAVKEAAARAAKFYEDTPAENNDDTAPADGTTTESQQTTEAAAQDQPTETKTRQPVTPEVNDESWEHRYKSMKGRFDRSQDQVRALAEQVSSLQNVIATMQARSGSSDDKPDQIEKLITEEEEKDYGTDFLKVVGKKAKEELTPEVASLRKKIADLETKLQGVGGYVAQDAQQRMLDHLDTKLANWREINVNDDFKEWLRLPDPYSGAIRFDMLRAAYAENNAPRVLAFFNGFLAEEAALAPSSGEPDPTAETVKKVPLETLAAPGRAKTAAGNNAPAEKPIFTRAQIAKFYADAAAGKYRGKEVERDRFEKQIFEAEREGRIR